MRQYNNSIQTGPTVAQFRRTLLIGFVLAILLIIFIAFLTKEVLTTEKLVFDSVIIDQVQSFISDALTPIMIVITEIGDKYVVVPVALLALFILIFLKRHYWEAVMLFVSLGGSEVIKQVYKHLVHRERPSLLRLIEETGFSFPSGHAIASITFYGMLAYIIWLNIPHRKGLRILTIIAAIILILLIGLSRIYLGVHYPSDVVGGYAVGSVWLITCILALNAIRYYKSDRQRLKLRSN